MSAVSLSITGVAAASSSASASEHPVKDAHCMLRHRQRQRQQPSSRSRTCSSRRPCDARAYSAAAPSNSDPDSNASDGDSDNDVDRSMPSVLQPRALELSCECHDARRAYKRSRRHSPRARQTASFVTSAAAAAAGVLVSSVLVVHPLLAGSALAFPLSNSRPELQAVANVRAAGGGIRIPAVAGVPPMRKGKGRERTGEEDNEWMQVLHKTGSVPEGDSDGHREEQLWRRAVISERQDEPRSSLPTPTSVPSAWPTFSKHSTTGLGLPEAPPLGIFMEEMNPNARSWLAARQQDASTSSTSPSSPIVASSSASASASTSSNSSSSATSAKPFTVTVTTSNVVKPSYTVSLVRASPLYTGVPSSWEPPRRSIWFQRRTIFIVSIFLSIFIVLSIGATVFLRDRKYDVAEEETDEDAIARIMAGRSKDQERLERQGKVGRRDARVVDDDDFGEVQGDGEGMGGGTTGEKAEDDPSARRNSKKARLRRLVVTRWTKAAASVPGAQQLFLLAPSPSASGSRRRRQREGQRGRDEDNAEEKDSREAVQAPACGSSDSARSTDAAAAAAAAADVRLHIRSRSKASQEGADGRNVRNSSSCCSSTNSRHASSDELRRRAVRRHRPRLGDGRSERVEIAYDPQSHAHGQQHQHDGLQPSASTGELSSTGADADFDAADRSSTSASRSGSGSGAHPATTTSGASHSNSSQSQQYSQLASTAGSRPSSGSGAGAGTAATPAVPSSRLDASDLSAAEVAEANASAGATASSRSAPPPTLTATDAGSAPPDADADAQTDANAEELFPPAYPTRGTASRPSTGAAAVAAVEAAARTERKADVGFGGDGHFAADVGNADSPVIRMDSVTVPMVGAYPPPPMMGISAVAHIATDDKAILGAMTAAASRPLQPSAPSALAPMYANNPSSDVSAAVGADEGPSAPELDVDEDGFEHVGATVSATATTVALAQRGQDAEGKMELQGKGKGANLLPQPPIPHTPSFSVFDQPYSLSLSWPPRSSVVSLQPLAPVQVAELSSPSTTLEPTPAVREKEREAQAERALLASSPIDLDVLTAGAALPAYTRNAASGLSPMPTAHAPSAPALEEMEGLGADGNAGHSPQQYAPSAPPAEDEESERTEEGRYIRLEGQGSEGDHPEDADGCPQI